MKANQQKLEPENIDQLMAEADELIHQIHSDAIEDMEEAHRLKFEQHAQKFNEIKSEVQEKMKQKETSDIGSSAEGMHEAIQDIVKAMRDLKEKLF